MNPGFLVTLLVVVSLSCGCSSRQLYDTAQGWQKNECDRLPDALERESCLASSSKSFEDYQQERRRTTQED